MAEAFIAFVSWLGAEAAVASVVGTVLFYTAALTVSASYSASQQRRAARQARDAYNASLQDRLVMVTLAGGQRSRVYGRVRNVEGVLFKATRGENSEFYTLVVSVAGHEVDAIEEVYFDDVKVTLDDDGYVQTGPWAQQKLTSATEVAVFGAGAASMTLAHTPVNVVSVELTTDAIGGGFNSVTLTPSVTGAVLGFTVPEGGGSVTVAYQYQEPSQSKARVRKYLGGADQDLSGILLPLFPDLLTANDRFAGDACLIVDLEFARDIYQTGVPTITALLRGAKDVFDPRTNTSAWTENPALIARDWAYYQFGGNFPADTVRDADVIASANACDVSTYFTSSSAARPLYTCGIVCRTDQDPSQTYDEIIESMAGRSGWSGGVMRMRAGVYRAPVGDTITEDWLSGVDTITVVPEGPADEAVNIMRSRIADSAQAYTVASAPDVRAEAYITLDGRELARDVTYGGVTDVLHAQHVSGVILRESRSALTVTLPCNLRAFSCELFDVKSITLPRFGWEEKEFEVSDWRFSLTGGVTLTLRETGASIFDLSDDFTLEDATPNTQLPNPFNVPTPTGLELASGTDWLLLQADGTVTSQLHVSWLPLTDAAVVDSGAVEVRWGLATEQESAWNSVEVPGGDSQYNISDVREGTVYIVKLRARNSLVRGQWTHQQSHRVVGKTEPPSNVANFALTQVAAGIQATWTKPTDLDWGFTEIRAGTTWASGTVIFKGKTDNFLWTAPSTIALLPSSWLNLPLEWTWWNTWDQTSGVYPFSLMAKNVDTTYNQSATEAVQSLDFIPGSNVESTVTNFDNRNDRLSAAIVDPTIAGDGTAIDHTIQPNGSADLSFEWGWSGVEEEIDGFEIMVRPSSSSSAYTAGTTPAEETEFFVSAHKRVAFLLGINPSTYYSIAVRAYRMVDPDINADGVMYSNWVQPSISPENPYRPASAIAFDGDLIGTIDGVAVATVSSTVANFNTRNDRIATAVVAPTIASDGTAIDHVINANGSADISFEWLWSGTESDIDGYQIMVRASSSSSSYVIGTTPATEHTYFTSVNKRAAFQFGVNPLSYYTFGVRAYRVVDPDVNAAGVMYSAWVQPSLGAEDPYRPASSIAFVGDITGTIDGLDIAAANLAIDNFNARNDRNGTTVVAPTIASDGTAVDHALQADGSADVSLEWSWGGTEADIDGFQIMVHGSTSSSAYTVGTSPATEIIQAVPANKRATILLGVNATTYLTFAIRAYRTVDPDISAAGVLYSSWVQPAGSGEAPYRPASSVAFDGDVTGTVGGIAVANVNVWGHISGISVATGDIEVDAVTEVLTDFEAGPVGADDVSPLEPIFWITFTPDVDCKVIVTCSYEVLSSPAGDWGSSALAMPYVTQSAVTTTGAHRGAGPARLAMTAKDVFDVVSGASVNAGLIAQMASGVSANYYNISLTVELIKR